MSDLRAPSFLAGRDPAAAVRPAPFVQPARTPAPVPAHAPAHAPAREASAPAPAPKREAPPAPEARAPVAAPAPSLERVAHAVEVLRLRAELLAEQARADALEVGFLVARRILEAELTTHPEALLGLVKGALKRAGESRRIAIRVHPLDAKLVDTHARGGSLGISIATVEVIADPELERGDVVVDTDFGKVDGRLRTRLLELHRAVADALEESAA